MLTANVYELLAQSHIFINDFDKAYELLKLSNQLIEKNQGVYSLYIQKWLAVINLKKNKKKSSLKEMEVVKTKARELNEYETNKTNSNKN